MPAKTRLATAIKSIATKIRNLDLDTTAEQNDAIRTASGLLRSLAEIVKGTPITTAFHTPGYWGWSTEIGMAVDELKTAGTSTSCEMNHPFTKLAPGNWGEVYDKFASDPAFPPEVNALQAAFAAGVAWERERCANICEAMDFKSDDPHDGAFSYGEGRECAMLIRGERDDVHG